MKGYSIRNYEAEDYEAVIKIWQETGMGRPERGDDKDTIERCLKTGGKLLILVDDINNIIAGTSWMTCDGRRLYLHHFGIAPEYQGKGLSGYLLEESLKYVKETGYQVKLEVHSSNSVAIKLYEKYGFSYLGDYKVFIIRNTDDVN
ncbi:MAG TPA: GNAT family N-acetyltransferase [Bacteroidetes bacterium]|nr:GNAT family N-acetyltransferase [Bacteroidota bacterium]